jgi:glycosyltransferase involved in cell wall biosynthesis
MEVDIHSKKAKYIRTEKIILYILIFLSICLIEFKDHSRIISLIKSRKYINICFKTKLINPNLIQIQEIPKITIIIPIFNCQDSIKYAVRSVQNQNISNFELILINDLSLDNSLNIIIQLSQEDSRIRVLNNLHNMGTLYSRCIGVIKSKGKYILSLDNDDLFMNYDIFYTALNEMEKGKYDILEFHAIRGRSYSPHISEMIDDVFHENENNLILNQPNLGQHSITRNGTFGFNNIHIWGKCIKKEIYKKSINLLGKEKYNRYICWAEDTLMVFILFNLANSYKFINIYSIFHLESNKTTGYTQSFRNKVFGELFLLDIMINFFNNKETIKYIFNKALDMESLDFFNEGVNYDVNKKYLKTIIKKFIKCKNISYYDKIIIVRYFINYI